MKIHSNIPVSKILSIVIGIIFTVSLSLAGRAYADQYATIDASGTFTDVISGIVFNLDLSADENFGDDVGPADATHIKFVHGDIENWVDLVKIIGRLEVEVLEYQ